MTKTVVIATNNAHKVEEIESALSFKEDGSLKRSKKLESSLIPRKRVLLL